MKKLQDGATWLGAGTGVGVPALTFFEHYTPPLFPQVGLILTALSGALLYALTTDVPQPGLVSKKALKVLSRRALGWIGIALLSMIAYVVLLHNCTVLDPQNGAIRFQVGFGTEPWSLRENGRKLLSAHPDFSADDLMMADTAYVPGGPERIWTATSILLAGISLILSYLAAFLAWTTGFGLLARHQKMSPRE